MEINRLEQVKIRETTQWIRVCGSDLSNPVLLLMQMGPGLPIINETRRFQRILGLEQAFTVVYWDQPGSGLALRESARPDDLNPSRMVADTIALLELLRDRFGRKIFVAGFSFGATFATYAAVQRPELIDTLVAVGMDVDIRAAERNAYDFALRAARQRHHRRAIRQLEAIGPPPHLNGKQFTTRVRWMWTFGGVASNSNYNQTARTLAASLLRSPDYSIADVVRTVRGISTTQAALLPLLANTYLVETVPRIDVPIVLVQGELDQVAPLEPAQRFYDSVTAPYKRLEWFERSAHTPHLEEPGRFREALMSLRHSKALQ